MSAPSHNNPKPPARGGNAPSHIVWFVPEREGAPWTRIGRCWPTKTGKGLRLALDLAPLGAGSLLVLPNEPRGETTEEGA